MSLKTNAKKTISFYILVTSLVLLGLVGFMSFNSSNIVANADAVIGTYYNIDDLTLNYNEINTSFGNPIYRIINAKDNLTYNDYRGLFAFDLEQSNANISYPIYPLLPQDFGIHGLSKFVQYRFKGTVKYSDKILISSNPTCSLYFIYSCPISYAGPSISWHFYDSSNNLIFNTSVSPSVPDTRTNTLLPAQVEAPNIPANAHYYNISLISTKTVTLYTFYPYPSVNPNILTYSDKDIDYVIKLYDLTPELYWHRRFIEAQENLRLAQEEGATVVGALESITTAPINAIAQFMDFEIPFFNVNLGSILAIIITLMLVGFVIKILMSKG